MEISVYSSTNIRAGSTPLQYQKDDEQVEDSAHPERMARYRERLEKAASYGEVWEIVRDSVKEVLKKHRVGMMLFLDDLSLNLGAYHPVGTNNIIMNRALLKLVEVATEKRVFVNAFIYSILLHEYLHAVGYLAESEVRPLVATVSEACFGYEHITSKLAREGPWLLLHGIPLDEVQTPKRVIEIVRDFEKSNERYIA